LDSLSYSSYGAPSSVTWVPDVLIVIRTSEVGNTSVVVMSEVTSTSRTDIADVVGFLPDISVQLSSNERTLRSHVTIIKSFTRKIVMLPVAKDIQAAGIRIVDAIIAARRAVVARVARVAVAWIAVVARVAGVAVAT